VNPVVLFLVVVLALSVSVAAVWWWVLRRSPVSGEASGEDDPVGSNVAVYREQLAELERDRAQGTVSEAEYHTSRDELTRRLLEDAQSDASAAQGVTRPTSAGPVASPRSRRWLAIGLAFYVPLAGLGLYGWLGQPLALDPVALSQGEPDHAVDPAKLTEMVAKLEQRLRDEPQQVEGWIMLGRVQRALERFDASAQAYARALSLSANDDVSIERAEVLARGRGSFEGEPWQIILSVIQANPDHEGARLLAGSAAYSEGRYALALTHWKRVQSRLSPNSPDRSELDEVIAQAESRLGTPAAGPSSAGSTQRGAVPAAATRITGRVMLAPALAAQVLPTDTVFIYATAVQGSRMPLAIVRTTVAQLPFAFVLDESSAMSPQATLAASSQVTVRARISRSGDASPKPGDLGVVKTPVPVGTTGLELRIEGALP
jgi:cytochrome c-type biogenesis protein CcmH